MLEEVNNKIVKEITELVNQTKNNLVQEIILQKNEQNFKRKLPYLV